MELDFSELWVIRPRLNYDSSFPDKVFTDLDEACNAIEDDSCYVSLSERLEEIFEARKKNIT